MAAVPFAAPLYGLGFFLSYFMNDMISADDHVRFVAFGLVGAVPAFCMVQSLHRHQDPRPRHPMLSAAASVATAHLAFLAVFYFFMVRDQTQSNLTATAVALTFVAASVVAANTAVRWCRP